MDEEHQPAETQGTTPAPEGGPNAQDGPQPQAQGQQDALAEAGDIQDAALVTHVRAATIRAGDRRITHGAYLNLDHVDRRTRIARAERRLKERIAKVQGYDRFEDVPEIRAGLIEEYVRLRIAAGLMWGSFLVTGRLPDRRLDFVNAIERLGKTLGLDPVLKDAKPPDIPVAFVQRHGNGQKVQEAEEP